MDDNTDWELINNDIKVSNLRNSEINELCSDDNCLFKRIDQLKINDFKRKKTVFILGSGSSINNIKGGINDISNQGDIIGLNFSLLLDVIPNIYFVHEPWLPRPVELERYFNLLKYRENKYKNTPFIYDYRQTIMAKVPLEIYPNSLRYKTYLNAPLHMPTNNTKFLTDVLSYYKNKGWFNKGNFSRLSHHMSTMSLAVCFAICSGYENIVLLGVDLKDNSYFFDDVTPNVPLSLIPIIKRERNEEHSTAKKDHILRDRSLPIDIFLSLLNEKIMAPMKMKLYIGSKDSLLYPRLPLWDGFK